ncbi:lysoplasmalogenase [Treponema putidum]|uniref:Lysoplasmalogenase n=1 Tax=Treponema putidum TaxID=221027 RepID=A0AAE9MW32_9SPIR|nr:lysoplasmalogenase [Treponema putidum]AIN93715.1 membrane protein [Treponema putidum]TWI77817.1 putative membrane protein YhhN [Treponema putidum]UTY32426.1 lysoplasmalogenase [Treponema putidum]UTY34821.1 lysoplasmalogenase [Treponema putidum]
MYNECLDPLCIAALALFLVISIIHLIKCFQQRQKWADMTKFMLMPALLLFFLAFSFVSIKTFSILNVLIIIALVFSFLGDAILLFDREKQNFALGILFFAITQISYIVFAILGAKVEYIPIIPGIVAALIFLAAIVYIIMRTKKQLKGLKPIVVAYGLIISLMSWIFIVFAFANPSIGLILAAIGSVLFIISDTMVSAKYFFGGKAGMRFLIMITYIFAQVLIVFGAIGIIGA